MLFFATTADITPIIQDIETDRKLDYYEAGLFDSPAAVLYSSLVTTPIFEKLAKKEATHCSRYLVLASPSSLQIREILQNKGGYKYTVDQLINPESLPTH